ncbi:MAG: DUF1573 domain-containing protein [Candidatus Omnitrophota bacterium]|nr:DUF1573 domain-containing protein [Candidatus Omnitrophota bacterium]
MKKVYSLQFIVYSFILFVLCSFSFVFAENITTTLEDNRLDLGKVGEGAALTQSFFVENHSSLPVKISVETLSCSCFTVLSPKSKVELAVGARQEVTFNFNTTGFEGKISKPLYIYTSDSVNSVIKVEVFADIAATKETFIRRFLSFGSLTVLSVGFIDGVNPCAFTVMVFFISFLSFAGYRKRDMLIIGSLFIIVVYITYLLIGAGLFKALRSLEVFSYFSQIFYRLIALFAFAVGLVSLYDFWIYNKTKDADRIILKLPVLIKRKIQGTIRAELIRKEGKDKPLFAFIAASISCGFLVSVLELFCTGQLYLPTIAYILKVPDLRIKAMAYLLLYNLMFILPLVAVFVLAFFGLTSIHFEKAARRHLSAVKLITAVLFFGLGVVLLIARS